MDRQEALVIAARELSLEPTDGTKLYAELVAHINQMLQHDFDRLMGILYRIDVSEARLRYMLQSEPDTDAATLITNLIIERQWQKIKTRQEFRRDENIDENDKW